jgi:hypothetical protein
MGLKVDTIQNASSATVNMTLDVSGNVAVGNNLTVAGTTTLTGAVASGAITSTGLVSGTTGALYPLIRPAASQTASGSAVNFTAIPSWVNRITVQIAGLSYAAAGVGVIRIGSSSTLVTTGYTTASTSVTSVPAVNLTSITNGLGVINTSSGSTVLYGAYVLTHMGSNLWQYNGQIARSGDDSLSFGNGYITLAGALDVLSLVATSSTFDAGTINMLYE